MSSLRNKSILIISGEAWGDHFVSKHHYALELSKLGNRVFFLNPPNGLNGVEQPNNSSPGVHVVNFEGTRGLRFLPSVLARRLQQKDAKKLAILCATAFDVVWSFDNSRFYDLTVFGRCLKIAHIMDLAVDFNTKTHASTADFCFGVTREIVARLAQFNGRSFFINHGFAPIELKNAQEKPKSRKQVGYSGNLLLQFIDRELVLSLVSKFPEVDFNFYGGFSKSNLSDGEDLAGKAFIAQLKQKNNVFLHGVQTRADLLAQLQNQDILLLFYDAQRYGGACHNSHKIMEYLSTGKEILSLPIFEYSNSELITQADNHAAYREKFVELLAKERDHELQAKRVAYAADHTYLRQIERIQKIIDGE